MDNSKIKNAYDKVCAEFGQCGRSRLMKETGLSERKCKAWLRKNKPLNSGIETTKTGNKHTETNENAESTANGNKPYTQDEIIKLFNIDTEKWQSERMTTNSWDVINSEGKCYKNYQTKVFWKRIIQHFDAEKLLDNFIKRAEKHSPVYKPIKKYKFSQKDKLLVINLRDLHLGKLCYHRESGFNYDIKIAMKYAKEMIDKLIQYSSPFGFEEILFITNDDLVHIDNNENSTSHGTKQDVDGRLTKMMDKCEELLVSIIDNLQQYSPVKLMFVNGNHSEVVGYGIERIINAWYRNNDDVNFINLRNPEPRKYYKWGKCMIAATHGQKINIKNISSLISVENPKMWGETIHRTCYAAHLHHKEQIKPIGLYESQGCVVKMCRSLAIAGKWANDSGYIGSLKGCEAEIFHKENGSIASFDSVINIQK